MTTGRDSARVNYCSRDIDRLETIDHQFRRANELAATDPEAAALLYAVASEWFRSLFEPSQGLIRPVQNAPRTALKAPRIDFQVKEVG